MLVQGMELQLEEQEEVMLKVQNIKDNLEIWKSLEEKKIKFQGEQE